MNIDEFLEMCEPDSDADPSLLPEELQYVWAWLAMKSAGIADDLAARHDTLTDDERSQLVQRMTFIAALRDEVFDTADEWAKEARLEALDKLDQWERIVRGGTP